MKIELKGINKSFGDKTIYKDFNICFTNNINCILGKSGGGKSTLLNIISGLEKADSGNISGINLNDISYVFQEHRLIPWLTVKENIELFIYNYYSKEEAEKKFEFYLNLLELSNCKENYIESLSGGMKQRINILRALLKPSKVILMDEPFKSLDYKVKYNIMKKLKSILKEENRSLIFVTHDVDEAIYMEGEIFILGGVPFKIKGTYSNNLYSYKDEILNLI